MERVKRLAGNEIELRMRIPTIDLGQVTYRQTKGITYVVIKVQPIKDLRRICRSQYGHPGPAIGY